MLATILTRIGLPVLTNVVATGLEAIDSPVAKSASKALSELGGAFERREITPEQLEAANRHVEAMARLSATRETEILAEINRTMRAEVQSEDAYVRRWRPTFGYAVAATWLLQMAGLTYAIVATPQHADEILAAVTSLSVVWSVALSVLGINVAKRSQDKALAAGRSPKPGLIERLAGRLAGGGEGNPAKPAPQGAQTP